MRLPFFCLVFYIPTAHNCLNDAEATATRDCVLPRASLVLATPTAQKIFAISSSRDKNSCHNFARLSAWCVRPSAGFPRLRSERHGGTPTPDCHVERSRNISWKGNDVNCRKIVCLVFSVQSTQADKRTLIRSVLIHGMCNFKDGTRAARRREYERRA